MSFKQPREAASVRVVCEANRLYGEIHMVPGRSTADLFNLESRPLVPMSKVQLFSKGFAKPSEQGELQARLGFLALNRCRVLWIAGGRAATLQAAKETRVGLVFEDHLISGQVQVPQAKRLTDHLQMSRPFVTVLHAALYPVQAGQSFSELHAIEKFEFLTVNTFRAVAIVEG